MLVNDKQIECNFAKKKPGIKHVLLILFPFKDAALLFLLLLIPFASLTFTVMNCSVPD